MVDKTKYSLLNSIDTPIQLRELSETELPTLASELRDFIIESVGQTGGHLSAGLGTVELTIALHYVMDTPQDLLVWDVGHQSYPHKILTGRRSQMHTLRQKNGLAGFPKRDESKYDTFGVGHSSTSISAALGMALAAKRNNSPKRVSAIIGDGAMTAGMAFEALNHAGDLDANILVILNDNEMSISPNVGGLSNYLAKILTGKLYSNVREGSKKVLQGMPTMAELAKRAEEHVKGMVIPGTLFEELGFNYVGPIDGHNLPALLTTLSNIKKLEGPQFLHVITKKGKGYAPAEENPCKYHGVSAFNLETGSADNKPINPRLTYTQVFGQWLCDMAKIDDKLIAITPAMREGSGMVEFSEKFPEQYIDVGIAEQHAVTLAGGLAVEGQKPVVAIYSTFLQRAYDQLIHDIAIQNLPVLFAIDRAGLVGPDGPTHAGSFDISFLRAIPNLTIMLPADENETRQMLYTGFRLQSPATVRYPRGMGPGVTVNPQLEMLDIGKAQVRRQGSKIAILAFGSMVTLAEEAGEILDASVVNMRFVKPLDHKTVLHMATRHELIITIEENAVMGGAGSAVTELVAGMKHPPTIINLGIPDRFIEHGTHAELLDICGLNVNGILRAAHSKLQDSCSKVLPAGTIS